MLSLVGLFIWLGAQAEKSQVEQEAQLHGLRVRDVMVKEGDSVKKGQLMLQLDPAQTLAEVAADRQVDPALSRLAMALLLSDLDVAAEA